jgi:hypothetical protein
LLIKDGEEIKNHKWYRAVNFEDILKRKIPSPWIPPLKNEQDSQWFEEYPDSDQPAEPLSRELNELFDGF